MQMVRIGENRLMVIWKKNTTDVFKLCFNLTTGSAAQWFYAKFSQLEII